MKTDRSSNRRDRDTGITLDAMAERMARFHRVSWREALGGLAASALRLHRYRNAHHRLLVNALCRRDCPPKEQRPC